jgi:hypothetical protein
MEPCSGFRTQKKEFIGIMYIAGILKLYRTAVWGLQADKTASGASSNCFQ